MPKINMKEGLIIMSTLHLVIVCITIVFCVGMVTDAIKNKRKN